MNFTDKVVLVTGASSGIGKSIAIMFAKHNAKLALVGRNKENLLAVGETCAKECGNKPLSVVADLATDEGCERTARLALEHYGRLNVLVNNAAISARGNIVDADMETLDQVFRTNLRGVYNLTRRLVSALIETKGNIVNISSIAASCNIPGTLPYAVAKAGLDHFTNLIALEMAPKGVRANTVSPGVTVSTSVMRLTGYTEEEYQAWLVQMAKKIPLGRVCDGDHIASMVLHLASDASELITGANIPIDGGARYTISTAKDYEIQVK